VQHSEFIERCFQKFSALLKVIDAGGLDRLDQLISPAWRLTITLLLLPTPGGAIQVLVCNRLHPKLSNSDGQASDPFYFAGKGSWRSRPIGYEF
jgi:hypothetical protein